ncbi:MAG: BamA/TamA family outer membrane protein [Longimicrobiales bacterium]
MALSYALTYRDILDSRPGGTIGQDQDLVDVLRSLDTLNLDRRTSSLALSARWGPHGAPSPEAWDWSVQGTGEIAGPPGLSMVEYGKVVMEGSVGRLVLPWLRMATRVGFGRVFPYGVSVPAPDGSDRLEVYLKLRDATLTAGGARDVRGWANELLGPKLPDFRLTSGDEGDDAVRAGRYIPLGGLARWTGSLQLEFPFPGLGWPHGAHLFLDGGRVWTPDGRFLPTAEPLVPDQLRNRPRFGTGLGVSFSTPVGPLQLDLGYKLNPTLLDMRSPWAVARALAGGEDVASVPEEALRRWHLHFSIGRIR